MQIQPEPEKEHRSWLRLVAPFSIYAVLIFGASSYLPVLAERIQEQTGWGQSFIGISFIAVTTCLPELAVSVAAAKRRSFEIAVGSLLGSTLCYMVILAITDFCYGKEPLLRHVSSLNALAALTAIISMAIVVIALTYRAEKKFLFIAGDALGLLLVYLLANVFLFIAR
jgi:cation:H+ antiporter